MMQTMSLDQLSINQATTRPQWTLEEAIKGYAASGVHWIAPWRDKLADCGLTHAKHLLKDHGMRVSGLCRGGMFPYSDQASRQAVIDDNLRAIEEAATIEALCLVLVCGGLPEGSKDISGARSMVTEMISEILPAARSSGVPLAIEPLHPMYAADRACINTVGQANHICDQLGDGLGIAVDAYHVWWDPNLETEISRAGADRLLAFHVCDWLVPTQDMLLDRGMMGDGIIDLKGMRKMIEAAGYDGPIEVEIFSQANWWQKPAPDVVETVKERFLTVC